MITLTKSSYMETQNKLFVLLLLSRTKRNFNNLLNKKMLKDHLKIYVKVKTCV